MQQNKGVSLRRGEETVKTLRKDRISSSFPEKTGRKGEKEEKIVASVSVCGYNGDVLRNNM